jgi:hypothetical protein
MRRLLALLLAIVILSGAAGGSASTGRSISLIKVSAAPSGIVTVTVRISGWKMYPARVGKRPNKPNGGHWHIFVDGKYNSYSANATTGKTGALKKGVHTISVALANNDHSPLAPPVKSRTIRLQVGGPVTPPSSQSPAQPDTPPSTTPQPATPPGGNY